MHVGGLGAGGLLVPGLGHLHSRHLAAGTHAAHYFQVGLPACIGRDEVAAQRAQPDPEAADDDRRLVLQLLGSHARDATTPTGAARSDRQQPDAGDGVAAMPEGRGRGWTPVAYSTSPRIWSASVPSWQARSTSPALAWTAAWSAR